MTDLYISYNIGSSTSLAGLKQLINLKNPLIIFLQEVTVSSEQLLAQIGGNFLGVCNVNEDDSSKPGNAVLWRKEINVVVVNVVAKRIQLIKTEHYGNFINTYAPTGTQGEQQRRDLFSEDLLPLIQVTVPKPCLVGDWNCIARREDTEDWESLENTALARKISVQLQQLI